MDAPISPFQIANDSFRRADYLRWHRQKSRLHILRSQLGFDDCQPSRPAPCQGCLHYHGVAYGYTAASRQSLVCGYHPYGWQGEGACPDWCDEGERSTLL